MSPEDEKTEDGTNTQPASEASAGETSSATQVSSQSKAESEKQEVAESDTTASESIKSDKKEESGKLTSEKELEPTDWPDPEKTEENSKTDPEQTNSDSQTASATGKANPDLNPPLTQHHVSHLLTEVLSEQREEEAQSVVRKVRFPIILDVLLAGGLLFAVGGFSIGLFHMYIAHSAAQSISLQKYKEAIAILKAAPLPQVFSRPGSETEDMLSKAIYLDALERLEAETDMENAIKDLNQIKPGSKYFALAQETIDENTEPAPVMLQGGAETIETNPGEEQKSLLDKTLHEDEKKK